DEEGVRFGATLIGSKAMAGRFDPAWLDKTDDAGITMRQALEAFGGDPDRWRDVDRRHKNVVAYVESHIEQGPVLLNDGLPVRVGCAEIAQRRRVSVDLADFFTADAAPCDAGLQQAFAQAIAAHGIPVRHLPSGAGHDAMEFPAVAPTAMLFVRCGNNGISHHPDETMTAEDAEIATSALLYFFEHYVPSRQA